MGKFESAKRKCGGRTAAIVLIVLLVVLGAVGFVVARYVSNYRKEAEIHASNFHFSSDYLRYEENADYTVSNWGKHAVKFSLFNYEIENVALISDTDIIYNIEVSDSDWTVSVTDGHGQAVAANNGSYTLPKSDAQLSHLVTLTYTGTNENPEVDVTVTATSPYSKVLKAGFTATTKKDIEYTVTDEDNYCVLTIHTNQYYGDITVKWNPETHSPDNTNELMLLWLDSEASGELRSAREFTTYTMIFVENKAHVSTKEDFVLTTDTGA